MQGVGQKCAYCNAEWATVLYKGEWYCYSCYVTANTLDNCAGPVDSDGMC